MTRTFRNVVLSEKHSEALIRQATTEGIIKRTERSNKKGEDSLSAYQSSDLIPKIFLQEAIDALLSHEKIVLTGIDSKDFDLINLEAEGLLATQPLNFGTAFSMIQPGEFLKSPLATHLAERALVLEPLLLKSFWDYLCNYPYYLKKMPKNLRLVAKMGGKFKQPTNKEFFDYLKTLKTPTRRHIWRWGMLSLGEASKNAVIDRNEKLIEESHKWFFKARNGGFVHNGGLFIYLKSAFPFFFELKCFFDLLKVEHYIQNAQKYDACMLHNSKNLSYEHLSDDEARFRLGNLGSEAVTAIRLSLNSIEGQTSTPLSLREVLKLRTQPEIIGFRALVNEVIEVAYLGNKTMLQKATIETQKAVRKMRLINKLTQLSSIATYLSVPVAIAEAILMAPPITGLTLSGTSTIVQFSSKSLSKKFSWVTKIK